MKTKSISFNKLPFSKLFQHYTAQNPDILDFYESNPFSYNDTGNRIKEFRFKGDRSKSVELLTEYNKKFGASAKTLSSIENLFDDDSLAVVTGQQLTIFGGPLFTIYKIIRAINYAKFLENEFKVPVVPVFWMADEDHDFEEVSKVKIPGSKEIHEFELNLDQETECPSGSIHVDEKIERLSEQIQEKQQDTDFSYQLWSKANKYYHPGSTIAESFGRFILDIFSDYGLILGGSNFKAIKEHLYAPVQKSVLEAENHFRVLESTSTRLEKNGYHRQVHLQKSNLFWLNEDQKRIKIKFDGGEWILDNKEKSWTTGDLADQIENSPHRFSPNVFLRPVLQDYLLPTIAYVAGPGEIGYYAQMKEFYGCFDIKMPIIMPRYSATIIESGIDRILKKLPFDVEEYSRRIEDLEADYVESTDTTDLENLFNDWKQQADSIVEKKIDTIKKIDPTLEGSAEKVNAIYSSELDKLKGKLYRSIKEQEKIQINRIKKIQTSLFPNKNLQEREVAFVYIMNKYGTDIWDKLLKELEQQKSDEHKIICL